MLEDNHDLIGLGDDGEAPASAGDLLSGLSDLQLTGDNGAYVAPKQCFLDAESGKGLEVFGTFARRAGHVYLDMTFSNKTLGVSDCKRSGSI